MKPGDLVAGRYRLLEPVGSGAMGAVWRGLDTELDRIVALKRAHHAESADDERIRREARIAAGVHHPGVVTLFDAIRDGANRWLVMEYVPSDSLAQVLAARGPLPAAEVARIGAALAGALEAVHAAGIVHRDIKPANVLIGEDGTVKLTDFGVSRGTWSEQTLTSSAMIIGTPAYLAPEVARGDAPTAASDLFGLGAVLFAAVEGAPPYGTADNPLAALRRAGAGQVAAFDLAGPLVPILRALLDLEPANRPTAGTARALLQSMDSADGATTAPTRTAVAPHRPQATLPGPPEGAAGRSRAPTTRARVLVAAAALVLVAAAIVALRVVGDDADRPAATPAGAAASLLGNPRTADPCALLAPAGLAAFGAPKLRTALGNFNQCDVVLGGGSDLAVQLLGSAGSGVAAEPGDEVTIRQFSVYRSQPSPQLCRRTILLPLGERVRIDARVRSGAEQTPCALGDAAVVGATDVLSQGALARRTEGFGPGSLGGARACDLLAPADLAAVRALRAADPQPGFGDWACTWSAGGASVDLRFDRDPPAEVGKGTRRTLSGHDAYVRAGAQGKDTCQVRIVNRRDRVDGAATLELVDLLVRHPGSPKQLCADATALAADVARRLPTRVTAKSPKPKSSPADAASERAERAAKWAALGLKDPFRAAECAAGAAG